jgi:hypothetical protein
LIQPGLPNGPLLARLEMALSYCHQHAPGATSRSIVVPLSNAAAVWSIPSNDCAIVRTRCHMGVLCQRPDAEHRRLFSHPEDPDWVGPSLGDRFYACPMSERVESARDGQCGGVLSGRLRLAAQSGPQAPQARCLDHASRPIQSHHPRARAAARGRSRSPTNSDSDFMPKKQAVHSAHSGRRRSATDKHARQCSRSQRNPRQRERPQSRCRAVAAAVEVLSSQEKPWRTLSGSQNDIPVSQYRESLCGPAPGQLRVDVDDGADKVLSSQEKQWRKSISSQNDIAVSQYQNRLPQRSRWQLPVSDGPMLSPTECVDLTSSPSTSPESIDLTSSPIREHT